MKLIQRYAKPVSLGMAIIMILICAPIHGVMAALIPTDTVARSESGQTARNTINALLDRDDIQKALVQQGLDPQEARERVAALSDAEAVKLANMIDELPAGAGFIGFLVVVALVIFLVLLITDLTGVTDVFPWVK